MMPYATFLNDSLQMLADRASAHVVLGKASLPVLREVADLNFLDAAGSHAVLIRRILNEVYGWSAA